MTDRVFILGAGRSGTKILRDCLGAAQDVAAVPYDVGYIWRHGNESVPHDQLRREHAGADTARFVGRALDRMARRAYGSEDYRVLIEKSVPNVLRPEFVAELFPDARFVSIVRDGRAVIESSMRNWREPSDRGYLLDKLRYFPIRNYRYALWYALNKTRARFGASGPRLWGPRYEGMALDARTLPLIDVCARQWRACVEVCAAQLENVPAERVFSLRYEGLADDGAGVLREVCDFCEIEDHASVRAFHERRFDPARGRARVSNLSAEESARIDTVVGPLLKGLDYV